MISRTPNVFVAGAGPVAATLAGALRRAGAPVLGLWGRRPEAVRAAGAAAGVATFSAAPPDLMLEADVVLIAVRDDAIGEVGRTLLATGLITKRHVFLHCSGVISAAEAFGPTTLAAIAGAGTLHPLRSIVDPRATIPTMKGTLFGIEGDEEGRSAARALAELLGGKPLDLDGDGMALYHAAASMASNHVVALLASAAEALGGAGLPEADTLPALLPLVSGTLENLTRAAAGGGAGAAAAALTGPIARGDVHTIERHLQALAAKAPDLLELYKTLARRTLLLARAKGEARSEFLDAVDRLLGS